jgi:hypothetical protein
MKKDFVTQYPKRKFHSYWLEPQIVKALYDGEAPLNCQGHTEWKGTKIHLFRDTLYLVDKELKSVQDVLSTDRPFIQFKSDSNYYQEIQAWWQRHFSSSPKRQITVDQIETCKQMALNGIGYAILPSITLTGLEDIHKIPLTNQAEELELTRDTWLISYESAFELRQVEAFVKVRKNMAIYTIQINCDFHCFPVQ